MKNIFFKSKIAGSIKNELRKKDNDRSKNRQVFFYMGIFMGPSTKDGSTSCDSEENYPFGIVFS
jgi:hypothetical protein